MSANGRELTNTAEHASLSIHTKKRNYACAHDIRFNKREQEIHNQASLVSVLLPHPRESQLCGYCLPCLTTAMSTPQSSPAVGGAHGAPQTVEERAAQATTRDNSNGSDGRDTRAEKRPGGFRSQYTRGAHSTHYPASLRTYAFASLSSFFSSLPGKSRAVA